MPVSWFAPVSSSCRTFVGELDRRARERDCARPQVSWRPTAAQLAAGHDCAPSRECGAGFVRRQRGADAPSVSWTVLGGGGGQPFALEGDVGAENFPEDAEACRLLAKAGLLRVKDPYYFVEAMAMVRADLLSGAAQRESEARAAWETMRSIGYFLVGEVRAYDAYVAESNIANAMRAAARAVARPGFYDAKDHLLRLIKACERAVEAARKACEGRPATTSEFTWHQLACDMWVAGSSLRIAKDALSKLVESKVFAPAGTSWSDEEIARFDKAVREVPKRKGGHYNWSRISDLVVTRSGYQCKKRHWQHMLDRS